MRSWNFMSKAWSPFYIYNLTEIHSIFTTLCCFCFNDSILWNSFSFDLFGVFIRNLSNGTPSFKLEMILELIYKTMSFAVLQRLHNIFTSNFKRYPFSVSLFESFSIHLWKKKLFSLHTYLQWKFFACKIKMLLIILFICSVLTHHNDVNGRHYC